jgi:hypothetical protein
MSIFKGISNFFLKKFFFVLTALFLIFSFGTKEKLYGAEVIKLEKGDYRIELASSGYENGPKILVFIGEKPIDVKIKDVKTGKISLLPVNKYPDLMNEVQKRLNGGFEERWGNGNLRGYLKKIKRSGVRKNSLSKNEIKKNNKNNNFKFYFDGEELVLVRHSPNNDGNFNWYLVVTYKKVEIKEDEVAKEEKDKNEGENTNVSNNKTIEDLFNSKKEELTSEELEFLSRFGVVNNNIWPNYEGYEIGYRTNLNENFTEILGSIEFSNKINFKDFEINLDNKILILIGNKGEGDYNIYVQLIPEKITSKPIQTTFKFSENYEPIPLSFGVQIPIVELPNTPNQLAKILSNISEEDRLKYISLILHKLDKEKLQKWATELVRLSKNGKFKYEKKY